MFCNPILLEERWSRYLKVNNAWDIPQGTTIALANAAGDATANFTYDSFGAIRSATGTQAALSADTLGDYRFQGMWLDDSGLYFVRARSYDPQTGRFLSRDPWRGEVEAPESLMPYAFVAGNPWMRRDPTGRISLMELAVTMYTSGILQAVPLVVASWKYSRAIIAVARGIQLGQQVFIAAGEEGGLLAEEVLLKGRMLLFENATILSVRTGRDLIPAVRQLLEFAQRYGATTLTFKGTIINPALAKRFGVAVGGTFEITVQASRSGLIQALRLFR